MKIKKKHKHIFKISNKHKHDYGRAKLIISSPSGSTMQSQIHERSSNESRVNRNQITLTYLTRVALTRLISWYYTKSQRD